MGAIALTDDSMSFSVDRCSVDDTLMRIKHMELLFTNTVAQVVTISEKLNGRQPLLRLRSIG